LVPAFVAALKKGAGQPAVIGAVIGSHTRWLAISKIRQEMHGNSQKPPRKLFQASG
jgi:hypothetical protein